MGTPLVTQVAAYMSESGGALARAITAASGNTLALAFVPTDSISGFSRPVPRPAAICPGAALSEAWGRFGVPREVMGRYLGGPAVLARRPARIVSFVYDFDNAIAQQVGGQSELLVAVVSSNVLRDPPD